MNENKRWITFKHWKTGETITKLCSDIPFKVNPGSDRIVVYNHDDRCFEDIIRDTIVEEKFAKAN